MGSLTSEINQQDFPEKSKHFARYVQDLKQMIASQDSEQARSVLRALIDPHLTFLQLQTLFGLLSQTRKFYTDEKHLLKVAVLGSGSMQQLASLIDLFLFYHGFEAQLYLSAYRDYAKEILDPASALHEFKADIILLLTDHRAITHHNFTAASSMDEALEQEWGVWLKLWNAMAQFGCVCIQNNFDYFPDNALGNYSFSVPFSGNNFIDRLNFKLQQEQRPWLRFHDLRNLVQEIGQRCWYDPRYYHHGKQVCSFEALPEYGFSVTSMIHAIYGKTKKCLVFDLDHTIWGGIIGDDGVEGIQIGQGSPIGEAYQDFQKYILALKQKGVLLAVCSKNSPDVAREPFRNHPDMILRLEDIVCFEANWSDKVTNLQSIASKLNISLDSIVFLDENPTERMLVRKFLPEVSVPYLPPDPSDFIRALERYRLFESVHLTQEDLNKTEQYKLDEKRNQLLLISGNGYDEYLMQLDLKAQINPFCAIDLNRIHQLLTKTNQFNVTGKRHTLPELEQIMNDVKQIGLSLRAKDRFGDYGLVSVLIANQEQDLLEITSWVMSCRVFSRGLEKYFFNHLYGLAQNLGIKKLRGFYLRTNRNGIVESLFRDLGFMPAGIEGAFERTVTGEWKPFDTFVQEYVDERNPESS